MVKPHTKHSLLYHCTIPSSASFVILVSLHASGQTDVQILDLIRWLASDEQSSVPGLSRMASRPRHTYSLPATIKLPSPTCITTTPLPSCGKHKSKDKSEGHSQGKHLAQHCQAAHQALLAVPLYHPQLSIVRHFGQSSCQRSD